MVLLDPALGRIAPADVGIEITIEWVTPGIAREWLAASQGNRRTARSALEQIGRDMLNGQYLLTGEAIIFGESGRLLDGHHRLEACVDSGPGFWTLVVRGIPDEERVMQVLDSGARRTFAHVLQIRGETTYTERRAAIVSLGWQYDQHRVMMHSMPTRTEQSQFLAANEELVMKAAVAAEAVNRETRLTPQAVGTAFLINARVDVASATSFMSQLSSGAGLDDGDPILVLRRWAFTKMNEREKPTSRTQLAYILKAMNFWHDFKTIQILRFGPDERMPEPWKPAS